MHDSPAQETLEIKNFGPIVEAKIDLRPLTVFIGPSNTGKSWLAILMYALHRHFSITQQNRIFRRSLRRDFSGIENSIEKWVRQTFTDEEDFAERNIFVPDFIMNELHTIFKDLEKELGNDILRCFGMDQQRDLIRKETRNGAYVNFRRRFGNNTFSHELTIKSEFSINVSIPEKLKIDMQKKQLHSVIDDIISFDNSAENYYSYRLFISSLIDSAMLQLVGPMYSQAFYLPADRTGIMHAHSTVVSAIIGNAPMAAIEPTTGTPRLSGVLSDFLRALIELDDPIRRKISPRYRTGIKRGKSWKHNLDKQIEKFILDGSVRMQPSDIIGYPHFTYLPDRWDKDLPLIHASSMVSELAPVVLYLRHLVQRGNTLIIEEPEAHLHPAMQAEFTRRIASMVHAGVRVIVTTHSEWVLETLANLVRLSDLPKAQRKETKDGNLALRPDQVGAWLFKKKRSPKGSVVEEIKFDPSAGGLESGYGEVAEQLYNEWAAIGNKIAETSK